MDRKQIEELLSCSICLDHYKQPKVLPCQHTFCMTPCLRDLADGNRVSCPICRSIHKIPKSGIEGFPNNLTIIGLLDIHDQRKPSIDDQTCPECLEKNSKLGKCLHCDKCLCLECIENHSLMLHGELKQSVSKVKDRIAGDGRQIIDLKLQEQKVKENEKTMLDDLTQWHDRCLAELEMKKKEVEANIFENTSAEISSLKKKQENLEADVNEMMALCEKAENLSLDGQEHVISILNENTECLKKTADSTPEEFTEFLSEEALSVVDTISKFRGIGRPRSKVSATAPSLSQPHQNPGYPMHPSSQPVAAFPPPLINNTQMPEFYANLPPGPCIVPYPGSDADVTGQDFQEAAQQVQQYYYKGPAKRCFGTKGTDVGCFRNPRGIAVTSDDHIVVADRNNHRVQIFDASGNFIHSFGRKGDKNGQLDEPRDVCITSSGEILVADSGNDRIQVFGCNGEFISAFGQKQLTCLRSVAVNDDGLVFISDWSRKVHAFSMMGGLVRSFGKECLSTSEKWITVSPDNKVVVCEPYKRRVRFFDDTGKHLQRIPLNDQEESPFYEPSCAICDRFGNVIVVDGGYHRVQIFDKNGAFISRFGSKGSEPGEMDRPRGVAVLSNGDIVVSDTHNHRIQIF